MTDLAALKAELARHAEEIAVQLLGTPNRALSNRRELRFGRKGSIRVGISGRWQGFWHDFERDAKGSILDLISEHATGGDFGEAVCWGRRWLGWPDEEGDAVGDNRPDFAEQMRRRAEEAARRKAQAEAEQAADEERRTDNAGRIWRRSVAVDGTPAEIYLTVTRAVPRPCQGWPGEAVRFDPLSHALVLRAVDSAGETVAVQRIFLTADGQKREGPAGVTKQSDGVISGRAVQLPGPGAGPLLIAEGPETGLSVWSATGHETWIALGSMRHLALPEGRRVIACRDDDPRDAPASKALRDAVRTWRRDGLHVSIAHPWPERRGDKSDLNDTMKAAGPAAVRERIEAALRRVVVPSGEISLSEAKRRLAEAVDGFFAAVAEGSAPGDFVRGVKVTVGTGKSHAAISGSLDALERLRARDDDSAVVMAVPMHKLSEEIAARFEAMARQRGLQFTAAVHRGRTAKDPADPDHEMCRQLGKVREAQALAADVETHVCPKCPHLSSCSYLAQRGRTADLWIVAHQSLFHAAPATVERNGIAAVVVDESPWQAGLIGCGATDRIEVPLDQLTSPAIPVPFGDGAGGGARLEDLRHRLYRALDEEPDGAVTRAALQRHGFDEESGKVAHRLEWVRKVEKGETLEDFEPNRTIGPLTAIWSAVAAVMAPDGPTASGWLELVRDKDGTRLLRIRGRSEIAAAWRVPTLLIDAELEIRLVRPYWPGLPDPLVLNVETPHLTVRQAAGRSFSKDMLEPNEKAMPAKQKRKAKNLRRIRAFLLREARQHPGRALIVSNKGIVSALGAFPARIATAHYNAVAGRDEWGDVALLIEIGRPSPPAYGVENIAMALTGEAVERVEGYVRRDTLRREAEGSGFVALTPAETDAHPHPIAELVRRHICEGQINQAGGRGRAVRRTAETPLTIIALTDVALPWAVDRFLSDDDVLGAGLLDLMLAEGGIAFENPAHAFAAYPAMWKTEAAAKKAFNRERLETFPINRYSFGNVPNLCEVAFQRAGAGQKPALAWFDPELLPRPRAFLEAVLGPLSSFEIRPGAAAPQPASAGAEQAQREERRPFVLKAEPGRYSVHGHGTVMHVNVSEQADAADIIGVVVEHTEAPRPVHAPDLEPDPIPFPAPALDEDDPAIPDSPPSRAWYVGYWRPRDHVAEGEDALAAFDDDVIPLPVDRSAAR